MNVYIAHSSAYDFKKELYEPLQKIRNGTDHTFILPHDGTPINSKEILSTCDLVIAEVSHASTGLGIELGWANALSIPIVCIHKTNTKPSSALHFICNTFFNYHSESDLIDRIQEALT